MAKKPVNIIFNNANNDLMAHAAMNEEVFESVVVAVSGHVDFSSQVVGIFPSAIMADLTARALNGLLAAGLIDVDPNIKQYASLPIKDSTRQEVEDATH